MSSRSGPRRKVLREGLAQARLEGGTETDPALTHASGLQLGHGAISKVRARSMAL